MDQSLIPFARIENKIFVFRGVKVMLARDLASLYGVETKILNQAIRRKQERFPEDFMFQLTEAEAANLRSQIVTSSSEHGGTRYLPYAFTEQGVAMLSSVLRSKKAILVNIQIIRTFTKLREMLNENESVRFKLEVVERRFDEQFKIVFDALRRMFKEEDEPKPEIGFKPSEY